MAPAGLLESHLGASPFSRHRRGRNAAARRDRLSAAVYREAMKSPSHKPPVGVPVFALLLLAAVPGHQMGPWSVLWTAPSILVAAMLIAWAAESAQFFIAQGFALAILAWLQTLPEFAVEAVLAKNQQVPLLLANLTGALRLLTGLGWPMIYFTAALFYRRRKRRRMSSITLEDEHCVEIVGLIAA